jgi:hypothetical protein
MEVLGHAQVEQYKRMIWPVGKIKFEQGVIPVPFPCLPLSTGVVPGVKYPRWKPDNALMRQAKLGGSSA